MIPLVSIIMPVYNKELYMRKTLENICNQDFKNWELIIVDDGSTDNGKVIIEEYVKRDKRIFAYYQKNRGVSDARNNGLEYAKGEWIWFVDSDDIPSKNFLSEVFKMDIVKGTDVIVGNYSKVFPDGNYRILDQEEYRQHAREMGYSDELDKILKKQLDVLIDLAVKKGGPFDQNFTKKWYGFYQDLKEGYYGKSDYYK